MDFAAARKCSTNFSTTGLAVRCFSLKMATGKIVRKRPVATSCVPSAKATPDRLRQRVGAVVASETMQIFIGETY